MCLAIPSRIVERDGMKATIEVYGARKEINLMLMPVEVDVGDFVLVHAGFALQKVEHDVAKESLKIIDTIIEEMQEDPDPEEHSL